VQVDPAHPVQDVGDELLTLAGLGKFESPAEVVAGGVDEADVERGPTGQVVQVCQGHMQALLHVLLRGRAEHLLAPGKLGDNGVAAETPAVLVVE
jgi:hypothetical protein